MIVKDIMTTDVVTIEPTHTAQAAAKQMKKSRTHGLVVIQKGKLIGILSEGDIITKVIAENKLASKVKVKDIMTKEVIMILPTLDVIDAAGIMAEKHIKKLPVVSVGKLLGVVTAMDIVESEPQLMKDLSKLFLISSKKKTVAG